MSYTEDQDQKNPEPWKTNYVRESYAREKHPDNEEIIEARRVDFDNWLERHDAEVRPGLNPAGDRGPLWSHPDAVYSPDVFMAMQELLNEAKGSPTHALRIAVSRQIGRTRLTVPTDEALWDFADELLDAWNIEDTNAPSMSEDFRDRFVERFGCADEALIDDALALAGKGVQANDGHSYLVPARDLARYSETIRALLDRYASAWTVDGATAALRTRTRE